MDYKKKVFIGLSITFAVLAILITILFSPPAKCLRNQRAFIFSMSELNRGSVIRLSESLDFEWDYLYSFLPYTSKEDIYETIGYRDIRIHETVSEGIVQVILVKDGKTVCNISGYPDDLGFYFDFGIIDKYIKLDNKSKFIVQKDKKVVTLKLLEVSI